MTPINGEGFTVFDHNCVQDTLEHLSPHRVLHGDDVERLLISKCIISLRV